jgi:signal transduction histidine kinase
MSISDNGLGMSKELLENLFLNEKSTTREGTNHEPGNGLGLMLFKEFTENMGGSFTIESQEGVGSKFTVLLPQG